MYPNLQLPASLKRSDHLWGPPSLVRKTYGEGGGLFSRKQSGRSVKLSTELYCRRPTSQYRDIFTSPSSPTHPVVETPLPVAHPNGHIKTVSDTERGLTKSHATRQHTPTRFMLAHSLQWAEVTQ